MNKPVKPPRVNADALKAYDPAEFTLIPLHRYTDTKTKGGVTRKVGKAPLDFNWTSRQYDSAKVLARCVEDNRNVGVRLRADQLAVDVDPRNGGVEGFAKLCADIGLDESDFPRVKTGSGGLHVLMSKPANVSILDTLEAYPGVEFKSKGRQIVAAGSIHPDTLKPYEWLEEPTFGLPAAPQALLDRIARPERSASAADAHGGQYTQEQIAHALEALDPTDFRDHTEWLRLMMACHHASNGDARQEWIEWSTSDPRYANDADVIGRRWDSLHAAKPGGVTYRTLNHLLAEHGAASRQVAADVGDDFDGEESNDSWMEGGSTELVPIEARGLKLNKSQEAADTYTNALKAVHKAKLDPAWNELAQNVVLRAERLPWPEHYGRVLNDHVLRLLRAFLAQALQGVAYEPGKDNVLEAVATLAYQNKFNPVLDYLDSVKWDGKPRVESLFSHYFNCGDGEYIRAVSKGFMVSAVRRMRKPGCKVDTMPVLLGKQGRGKSDGMKRLFGDEYFTDSDLGSLRDKDAAMKLRGMWCKEFAEIESLTRAETGHLKAFVSSATDRQRDPYGRIAENQPRRIVFVATVNESGYLRDPTGGRRFWPLEVQAQIDLQRITADRDQLWAEAALMERRGDSHVLPKELWEEAGRRVADQTSGDPWADLLRGFLQDRAEAWKSYDPATDDLEPLPPDRVHSSELFEALGIAPDQQNSQKSQRIRTAMEVTLGWRHAHNVRIGKRKSAGYLRKVER